MFITFRHEQAKYFAFLCYAWMILPKWIEVSLQNCNLWIYFRAWFSLIMELSPGNVLIFSSCSSWSTLWCDLFWSKVGCFQVWLWWFIKVTCSIIYVGNWRMESGDKNWSQMGAHGPGCFPSQTIWYEIEFMEFCPEFQF